MAILNKIDSAWAWRFLRAPPYQSVTVEEFLIFYFLFLEYLFRIFDPCTELFGRFRLARSDIRIPRHIFVIIHFIDSILGLELS